MGKTAKEVVRGFYKSDILKSDNVMEEFFHPELLLIWNSDDGSEYHAY